MNFKQLILLILSYNFLVQCYHLNLDENSSEYWIKNGQDKLHEKLMQFGNLNKAKNVIFFLGDGMSIPTLTATRIYMGQLKGKSGESSILSFEKFPYVGLSKTYCVDQQVPDSACTSTAYLSGIKANSLTIGVNGNVKAYDCVAAKNIVNQATSLAAWAQESGMSTGIVTTTRVTHASPAGAYAHASHRNMESDYDILQMKKFNSTVPAKLPPDAQCEDIASQLISNRPGSLFNVILGGGRKKFLPREGTLNKDEGERMDNRNLINEWQNQKKCNDCKRYVSNRSELLNVEYNKVDYLLGLFNKDHMKYNLNNQDSKEPSLTEMTESAIRILQKNHRGYFLFVEGGKIDIAHHENYAKIAFDETVEFSKAVEKARDLTSEEDTLIVVTSDHAHTMSFSGYNDRGSNILGLSSTLSKIDKLPYTIISYANGLGYNDAVNGTRTNLTNVNIINNKTFRYPATVPLISETHGGDDVAIFALGPWSNLFTGVIEQHIIPHLISFAACLGPGLTLCSENNIEQPKF